VGEYNNVYKQNGGTGGKTAPLWRAAVEEVPDEDSVVMGRGDNLELVKLQSKTQSDILNVDDNADTVARVSYPKSCYEEPDQKNEIGEYVDE
jgi:hypothetical protein